MRITPDKELQLHISHVEAEVRRLATQMQVDVEYFRYSMDRTFTCDTIAFDLARRVAVVPGERTLSFPRTWIDHLLHDVKPRNRFLAAIRRRIIKRRGGVKLDTYRAEQFMEHIKVPPGQLHIRFAKMGGF